MTLTFIGGVAVPLLLGGAILAFALRRRGAARSRRDEIAPGRAVIAANLAGSRRRTR